MAALFNVAALLQLYIKLASNASYIDAKLQPSLASEMWKRRARWRLVWLTSFHSFPWSAVIISVNISNINELNLHYPWYTEWLKINSNWIRKSLKCAHSEFASLVCCGVRQPGSEQKSVHLWLTRPKAKKRLFSLTLRYLSKLWSQSQLWPRVRSGWGSEVKHIFSVGVKDDPKSPFK